MYIFLYKADRHSRSPYGRTQKQSSIRNDFNLAMMRQGLKNNYRIRGHGENEFQNKLLRLGIDKAMYGHLIEIDEAKYAVWLKLNYDQVGKGKTTYVASWKDLDHTFLDPLITQYDLAIIESKKAFSVYSSFKNHLSTVKYFLSRQDIKPAAEEISPSSNAYIKDLENLVISYEASYNKIVAEIMSIQAKAREYLEDHVM